MTEISTAGYHLILKLLNMYLVAYFQKNFEDEGNPIGKSIQAALDQSHKSANTNSSARRRLSVMFGERSEEDSANTGPAKFKRYRD